MDVGFADGPLPALGEAVAAAEPDDVATGVELTVGSATVGAAGAPPVAGSVAGGAVEIGPATATLRALSHTSYPTSIAPITKISPYTQIQCRTR